MMKQAWIGLWLVGLTSVAAGDDAKWRARVEKELPTALGRLERHYERLQGSATWTEYRPEYDAAMQRQNAEYREKSIEVKLQQADGHDVKTPTFPARPKVESTGMTQKAKLNFAVRGKLIRIELFPEIARRYDPEKPAAEWVSLIPKYVPFESVACTGPDLTFGLKRPKEHDDYLLQSYLAREEPTDLARHYVNILVYAPFSAYSTPLWNIITDKSYRLTDITEVVSRGRVCCKVEYNYRSEKTPGLRGGSVVLSPEQGWQIHESETRGPRGDVNYRCRIEYADEPTAIPFPKLVSSDQSIGFRQTMEFDRIEVAEVPLDAFLPTHYGLPDLTKPLRVAPSPR